MRCSSHVSMSVAARLLCLVTSFSFLPFAVLSDEPEKSDAMDFESKAFAVLDTPGNWKLVDVPLKDLPEYLHDKLEVEVLLDRNSLEDSGIDLATPVNLTVNGIAARAALQLLLNELELTYVIRDEALYITTVEAAKARLIAGSYPVEDLVLPSDKIGVASEFDARVRAALDKTVKWEFVDMPLSDVAKYLQQSLELDVLLDRPALNDFGIAPDQPVTRSFKGITARSGLRLLLEELELTYTIRDSALWITNVEVCEAELITRVYAAGDLLRMPQVDEWAEQHNNDLVRAIMSAIAPDTWYEVGGPGSIEVLCGSLVVSHSLDVHDQIEQLLHACRQLAALNTAEVPSNPTLVYAGPPGDARIRAALDVPISGEFVDASLREVIDYIIAAVHVPIVIDARALQDDGVDLSTPITASFSQLALRDVLGRILHESRLHYIVRNEVLHITTPEFAEECKVVGLYPVDDLVVMDPVEPEESNFEPLMSLIKDTIQPDTWDTVGGPGAMERLLRPQCCLIIAQTESAHEQIGKLISNLRTAKGLETERAAVSADESRGLLTRTYLLQPVDQQVITPQEVIPLVIREFGTETWTAEEGVYLETLGHSLVVKHRADVHRKLRSFLQELGVCWPSPTGVQPQGVGGGFGGGNGYSPPFTPADEDDASPGAAGLQR